MRRVKRGKRTAAPRARRRPAKPRHRLLRAALVAVAAAAVVGTGHWAWRAGWMGEAANVAGGWVDAATAGLGLSVREVLVEGRHYTPRSDLLAAVNIHQGEPLLAVDLDRIRSKVEDISWVRAASVQRHWPGTIHIVIEERRPIAIWQRDGRLSLVDRDGVTIATANLEHFADLVVIVGGDAPAHAPKLLRILNTRPRLRENVLAAVRVGERRWDIRFKSGVEVLLPEHGVPAAWARLADLQKQHGLLSADVEVIDMRLPDRLIVRGKAVPLRANRSAGART